MQKLQYRVPEWRRKLASQPLGLALCLLMTWVFPAPVHAGAVEPPDLSGEWILNEELSDNLEEKMAEMRRARRERGGGGFSGGGGGRGGGGRGGGGGAGGRGDRGRRGGGRPGSDGRTDPADRMRGLAAADSMSLSWQEPDLVVTTSAGERRIDTTGKSVEVATPTGVGKAEASWTKEGRLVIETKRLEGAGKRIEAFELLANGRLAVTVKRTGGQGPGLELTRVYDRTPPTDDPESTSSEVTPSDDVGGAR